MACNFSLHCDQVFLQSRSRKVQILIANLKGNVDKLRRRVSDQIPGSERKKGIGSRGGYDSAKFL